jgi:signal transduction histidine kinase
MSPPNTRLGPNVHQLVAYIAELELEVDRLRKQDQYLRDAFGQEIESVQLALECIPWPDGSPESLRTAIDELSSVIDDVCEFPASHPAHDEVAAIAVRPLVERRFRWQQRLFDAPYAVLHLELSVESINWFPARFRHILDNLLSNSLRYRDPDKGESRVAVQLNHHAELLELRVTDNGRGIPANDEETASEYLNRSAYQRSPGTGVGLAVVKLLIEQSGGSLHVESDEGRGSQFIALLPRFDLGDFLTE